MYLSVCVDANMICRSIYCIYSMCVHICIYTSVCIGLCGYIDIWRPIVCVWIYVKIARGRENFIFIQAAQVFLVFMKLLKCF